MLSSLVQGKVGIIDVLLCQSFTSLRLGWCLACLLSQRLPCPQPFQSPAHYWAENGPSR